MTSLLSSDQICYFCYTKDNLIGPTIKYCQQCYNKYFNISIESNIPELLYLSSIDQITDKIYLGNFYGALNKTELELYQITNVLVCACAMHFPYETEFIYKRLDMFDDERENLFFYLKEGIEFIEQSDKIYVHCQAGISRSASIVIAYLMWKNKMDYKSAKSFVKSKRKKICPNDGFEMALLKFENILKENNYKLEF